MPQRHRRLFTAEFKAQVVLDLIAGHSTSSELCRQHRLSPSLLTLWKTTALEGLPALFCGEDHLSQERLRIAELEQLVGRQALELEILKKASRLLPGTTNGNGRL